MTKKQNSAIRVHDLLKAVKAQGPEQSTAQAWAAVFDIPFKRDPAHYAAVGRLLALVSEELEDAYRQMKATDHSPDLYEKTFNRARGAIGLESLSATWKNLKVNLDGDTLTILKFCSEVLPDEGWQVEPDQLEQLRQALDELRDCTKAEGMPEDLRRFLVSQLEIIERALAEFPIAGAKSFDRAVGLVLVSYPEYEDVLKQHRDSHEVSVVEKTWSQVLTWSTRLSALRSLFAVGQRGHPLAEYRRD